MAGEIYKKPVMFALVATVVILAGTIVTMFYPMFTAGMHPRLENLKPYTALQLAGKDLYMREGCNNCHTQTVRPLKTEVMRYGEYSKAGEFTFDRPFLWGSKRTGPDLARIGGKYPDAWHYSHFDNPKAFFAQSNMPIYGWLKERKLDPAVIESHMKVNGFPYTKDEMAALSGKTELDALVAYMQVIGTAVARKVAPTEAVAMVEEKNPLAGDKKAHELGEQVYKQNCEACHGDDGKGGIGPSLQDTIWLNKEGDISDGQIYAIISNGTPNGMPPYAGQLDGNKIWALVSYIRHEQGKDK
jgi:cytochrome c oxidase cbb3-type subunit 2